VIDVRKREAFDRSEHTLNGSIWRDPFKVESWVKDLPKSVPVLVYCVHGHEVSQSTIRAFREQGIDAKFLQGGIEAWRAAGMPVQNKSIGQGNKWVTRSRPKIDRIACPWLVLRFVDSAAEFLYVPMDQVASVAHAQSATAYDVAANICETIFTHDGELCSFDAFIKHYRLDHNKALMCLANIVRAADTDRLDLAPQAAGFLAVSLGMSAMHSNDHAMLNAMLPFYDELYAWCVAGINGTDEQHNWKPA
jgi:rhodanese-related sulfurtransferase